MSATQDKAASLLSQYMERALVEAGEVVDLIVTAAREELPALDRECLPCCGTGADRRDSTQDCGACDGSGYVITDAGRVVIAFLQRHPASLTRAG